MTMPINTFQDILDAMEREPALRDALRHHILTDELLQLPLDFRKFAEEQRSLNEAQTRFNEAQTRFNEELKADVKELKEFKETQTTWNANTDVRLNRMEGDIGSLKGDFARTRTLRDADGIAADMGLEYTRTLLASDLRRMAGNNLNRDLNRSFRNADLVIEATDGNEIKYIAVEVSFTADQRELDRAVRNAGLISRFTGKQALAVIASVRNDRAITDALESGTAHWHPLDDRTPVPG